MIRAALASLLLCGCATPAPVICSIPSPPIELLTIPAPLRSVPADLKVKQ